ncbi:MAG: hypothetical protein ACJAXW_000545 [Candidatus Azotimanducaceae bacterium]|jgi:hypothetical protein
MGPTEIWAAAIVQSGVEHQDKRRLDKTGKLEKYEKQLQTLTQNNNYSPVSTARRLYPFFENRTDPADRKRCLH